MLPLANRAGLMAFRRGTLAGLTGMVGAGQQLGAGPVFTMEFPVKLNTRYTLSIQALSLAGISGGGSKAYPFAWSLPPAPPIPHEEAKVPWPQRDLPEATNWHPAVRAGSRIS